MRPVRKADNLPPSCAVVTKIWEPLTSSNPLGLSRPVMGLLYLYLYLVISCTFWHLKMGPSVCPETSVANYQPTPRINNITELNENCTFTLLTQQVVVIPYRNFGTDKSVQSSRVKNPGLFGFLILKKTGSLGFHETSIRNYHYLLRNSPEKPTS
jgi:hypothetical protein